MGRKQELFESVLRKKYIHEDFVGFTKEFLNGIQIVAPNKYNKEYSNFSFYVDGYYHIGNYKTDDGDTIAVLAVNLHRGETVERARGMQRNFVKALIERNGCSGAIVAFYTSEEPEKWRLSFIRMDYEFSKGKVDQKLTPAKRYSYLVGEKEPCTTALQRLFPIFDEDNERPSIDEIEDAFSVEKVTREFFDKYVEKYHDLREYLESNEDFVIESQTRGFTAEQFAKKLLGQIVFLYFIQKKGWLGVKAIPVILTEKEYNNAFYAKGAKSREIVPKVYQKIAEDKYKINVPELQAISDEDEAILATCVKGEPWGTGPRDFMRQIFDGCVDAGKNFFDDYLEPLFYTGLNLNRGENGFYAPLHRRIPFLNGGLFEQLDNYDWEHNDFNIPNSIFSNLADKGRDADGILDIFDRYNFTMNEDEPMEREVAIDPEMLGKVFENLLDVSDRKSKGAFYTPREIVHYMCQESLINYLMTKTGISESAVRDFILYGNFFKDEDTEKTKRVLDDNGKYHYEIDKEKDLYISEEIFSFKNNVNRLQEIDDLLTNVKVADLAVGSGAFPLGMLNEIVKARETLTAYLSIGMNNFQKKSFMAYGRKLYDLKINTIKNCIFACDIEPSAVDIAKLRLWLSIVIDDEITENNNNGQFDEHSKPRQLPNLECNIICGNSLVDEYKGIKLVTQSAVLGNDENYQYNIFNSMGVDQLLSRLIDLQDKLFFMKNHDEKEDTKKEINDIYNRIILQQIGNDSVLVEAYKEDEKQQSKPFVLWQLYFPKVFKENGGFDIVIGNPPYVLIQDMEISEELSQYYKNEFTVASYKVDLYHLFIEKAARVSNSNGVVSLITPSNFTTNNYCRPLREFMLKSMSIKDVVFYDENVFEANVNNLVFVAKKPYEQDGKILISKARKNDRDWEYFDSSEIDQSFYMKDDYIIIPVDSMNAAAIIEKMDSGNQILKKYATVNFGMQLRDRKKYPADVTSDEDLLTDKHKRCYTGKDIGEFFVEYNDLYCYFDREAKKGGCWDEEAQLANPKLLCRQIGRYPTVGIDELGYPVLNTAFMISQFKENIEPYALLGILNSSIIKFYWKQKFSDNRKQFPKIKGTYLEQLPIARNAQIEKEIHDVVNSILTTGDPNADFMDMKEQIDVLVANLYGLTEDEMVEVKDSLLD